MSRRIRLRTLRTEDRDQLFKIYSDKEAMKYRGSKPMESLAEAKSYVENQELLAGNILTIRKGIELVSEQELIGSSMYRFDDHTKGECEIGYSIGREYWGKGLGTEIVKTLVEEMEQNKTISDLIAWSNKENIASIKVLKNNGFRRVEQVESKDNELYRKVLGENKSL